MGLNLDKLETEVWETELFGVIWTKLFSLTSVRKRKFSDVTNTVKFGLYISEGAI
jgi:hypothetical protein